MVMEPVEPRKTESQFEQLGWENPPQINVSQVQDSQPFSRETPNGLGPVLGLEMSKHRTHMNVSPAWDQHNEDPVVELEAS